MHTLIKRSYNYPHTSVACRAPPPNAVTVMADSGKTLMFRRTEALKTSVSGAFGTADRERIVEAFNRENCSYYHLRGSAPHVSGGAAMSMGNNGVVIQRAYFDGSDLRVETRGKGAAGRSYLLRSTGRTGSTAEQQIAPGLTAEDASGRMPQSMGRMKDSLVVVSRGGGDFDALTKGQGDVAHAVPPMPILVGILAEDILDTSTDVVLDVYIVGEHWLPEPLVYVVPVASHMVVASFDTDFARVELAVVKKAFGAASNNLAIAAPNAESIDSAGLVAYHKDTVVKAFDLNTNYKAVMMGPTLLPHNPAEEATLGAYSDAITTLMASVTTDSALSTTITALAEVLQRFNDGDLPDAPVVIAEATEQQAAADAATRALGGTPAAFLPVAAVYAGVVEDVAEAAYAHVGNQEINIEELVQSNEALRSQNVRLQAQLDARAGLSPHTHPVDPHVPFFSPGQGGIPSRVHARHKLPPLMAKLKQLMRTGASGAEIDALISKIDRLNRVANA